MVSLTMISDAQEPCPVSASHTSEKEYDFPADIHERSLNTQ